MHIHTAQLIAVFVQVNYCDVTAACDVFNRFRLVKWTRVRNQYVVPHKHSVQ